MTHKEKYFIGKYVIKNGTNNNRSKDKTTNENKAIYSLGLYQVYTIEGQIRAVLRMQKDLKFSGENFSSNILDKEYSKNEEIIDSIIQSKFFNDEMIEKMNVGIENLTKDEVRELSIIFSEEFNRREKIESWDRVTLAIQEYVAEYGTIRIKDGLSEIDEWSSFREAGCIS